MSVRELAGTTAIVTGASRGFGRATVTALAAKGAHVVGVARSEGSLNELKEQLGDMFTSEVGDVTDGSLPDRLFAALPTADRRAERWCDAGAAPVARTNVGELQHRTGRWTFGRPSTSAGPRCSPRSRRARS